MKERDIGTFEEIKETDNKINSKCEHPRRQTFAGLWRTQCTSCGKWFDRRLDTMKVRE